MLKTGAEHLESLRDGRVVYIGGERGDDQWFSTGCLVTDGVIFLEDRTQAP